MEKAAIIATYLKTRHESKKHGGYDIYEDDKIQISYDTYFPNISIYIKFPGKDSECVYSKSGHGILSIYHPGAWEQYIDTLYPKALKAKDDLIQQRLEKEELERQKHFTPIDDRDLFKKS